MKILRENWQDRGWFDRYVDALESDYDAVKNCKSIEDVEALSGTKAWREHVYIDGIKKMVEEGTPFRQAIRKELRSIDSMIDKAEEDRDEKLKEYDSQSSTYDQILSYVKDNYDFVDSDEYTIYFNAPDVERLSTVVQDIASKAGLKPGMFGFESSFTTHEAYKDGARYRIGLCRKNDPSDCFVDFYGMRDFDGVKTPDNIW